MVCIVWCVGVGEKERVCGCVCVCKLERERASVGGWLCKQRKDNYL